VTVSPALTNDGAGTLDWSANAAAGATSDSAPGAETPRDLTNASNATFDLPATSPISTALKARGGGSREPDSHMWVTERWRGVVEDVGDTTFTCQLVLDLDEDQRASRVFGEIPRSSIEPDDLHLLAPGASFYLTVGTIPWNRKSQAQVSVLRFRRLPVWRKDYLQDLKDRARKRYLAAVDEATE
jgi:hypothetical protein